MLLKYGDKWNVRHVRHWYRTLISFHSVEIEKNWPRRKYSSPQACFVCRFWFGHKGFTFHQLIFIAWECLIQKLNLNKGEIRLFLQLKQIDCEMNMQISMKNKVGFLLILLIDDAYGMEPELQRRIYYKGEGIVKESFI